MNVIKKIYENWVEDEAPIVEALYTGGLQGAGVTTGWIRNNLPELTNWSRWTYSERITYLLLQPDLFPETLKFDFPKPPARLRGRPMYYGEEPFQYDLFPELLPAEQYEEYSQNAREARELEEKPEPVHETV